MEGDTKVEEAKRKEMEFHEQVHEDMQRRLTKREEEKRRGKALIKMKLQNEG